MIWISLVLAIFLLALAGYLLYFCFLISKVSLTVPFPASRHEPSPYQEERVEFPTADGSRLEGRWIAAYPGSSKVVLFCHELGTDLSAWHKYGSYLPQAGFNVFSFSFRRPPKRTDGVHQFTTGQWVTSRDREDVLSALRFLEKAPFSAGKKFGVLGVSKGANAALAALPHTDRIKAVVTDGAFSTIETVVDYIKKWIPIFIPYPWLYRWAPDSAYRAMVHVSLWVSDLRIGCRFMDIEPSLRRTQVPLFFIHGERDGYISPHQAHYLFDLTKGREGLWIVPGARHNEAVEISPAEYQGKVVSFLKENL